MRARERTAEAFRALDESWEITALGPGRSDRQRHYWRLLNKYREYFKMADGVCYVSQAKLGAGITPKPLSRETVNLLTKILAREGRIVVKRRYRRPNVVAPNRAALDAYLSRTRVQPQCVKTPKVHSNAVSQKTTYCGRSRNRTPTRESGGSSSEAFRAGRGALRAERPRRIRSPKQTGGDKMRAVEAEQAARHRAADLLRGMKHQRDVELRWDELVAHYHGLSATLPKQRTGKETGTMSRYLKEYGSETGDRLMHFAVKLWGRLGEKPDLERKLGPRPIWDEFYASRKQIASWRDTMKQQEARQKARGRGRSLYAEEPMEAGRRGSGGGGAQ